MLTADAPLASVFRQANDVAETPVLSKSDFEAVNV